MTVTRRDFFKTAGLLSLPVLAPRLAFAADGDRSTDTVIVIFQRGGMDGLQAVVPFADNDYYRLRPTIGIPRPGTGTNAAVQLDERFALNPAAAALKPLFDAGRLAVVHAVGLKTTNRSHFDCQDFYERGTPDITAASDGWVNRYLQVKPTTATFGAVGVGRATQPSLRGPAPVVGMSNIAGFRLNVTGDRGAQTEALLGSLYDGRTMLSSVARSSIGAIDDLATANPGARPIESGATYPNTTFGNQMKEVAQLIKSDLGLKVACVDIGGWDHHENINNVLPPLLTELSNTLAAFDKDLGPRMANVSVVTMTEFGRRAFQNGSNGTDHGSGTVMFVLGGGVAGRQVVADWPGLADRNLFNGDLDVTIDYREVLSELIEKRMGGGDLARIFPGYARSSSRRGLFVTRA